MGAMGLLVVKQCIVVVRMCVGGMEWGGFGVATMEIWHQTSVQTGADIHVINKG